MRADAPKAIAIRNMSGETHQEITSVVAPGREEQGNENYSAKS